MVKKLYYLSPLFIIISMSNENEIPSENKKPQKTEVSQTAELKNILQEMDEEAVPKLKGRKSGKVKTPSFITNEEISAPEGSLQAPTPIPFSLPEGETARGDEDETPTGDLFIDMEIFFKQLGRAYKSRYEIWESTSVAIMKVLKEMRTYNEIQSGLVINTVEEIEEKLMKGLKTFETKRGEIERYAGIEYKLIIKGFKKTLDLLQFQIKQLKLQNEINDLYKIFAR